MNWLPIEDLPEHWREWAVSELPPLVRVWNEQAQTLRNSGAFKTFMEKLRRQIAIETGIIERLYSLDRGITQMLIEKGIKEALIPYEATNQPVSQVVALIRDQETAIAGLFDFVGGQRQLSTSYIKQLHQVLTQHQDSTEALVPLTGQVIQVSLLHGDWKKHPNNPLRPDGVVHEYCPPEQVASEMDNLIAWHKQHQAEQVPPEIEAAWLHHRFTQIHPFQDGNGRVARCLASLVFIQAEWFPLALTRDDRGAYIDALEKADLGDLRPLIGLFAKSQKQAFLQSLALSEQVLTAEKQTQTILAVAIDKLKQNQIWALADKRQRVEDYATVLFKLAEERLQKMVVDIRTSTQELRTGVETFAITSPAEAPDTRYHHYPIVKTAKQFGYFADTRNYHSWLQLNIVVNITTVIFLSFHALGREYRGLLVCTACAYHPDNLGQSVSEIQVLSDTPFQFSYADELMALAPRFEKWLEEVLVAGLEYWNKSL